MKIIITFFTLLIIGFLILLTWKIPVNNFNLLRLNKNFESLSALHPLSSKRLLKFSDFGNFGESGGQCGYIIGEFRTSQLTKEEIMYYYKDLVIDSFKQDEVISLEVLFLDDGNFAHYPWSKWASFLYQKIQSSIQSPVIYLVIAASHNHLADGDIRCYLSKFDSVRRKTS